jgi:hypothetical protein
MWDEHGDPRSFACSASRGIEVVDGPSETNATPPPATTLASASIMTRTGGNIGGASTSSSGFPPGGGVGSSPQSSAGFRIGEKIGVAVGCTAGLLALGALGGYMLFRNPAMRRAAAARRKAARKSRPSEIKAAPEGRGPGPEKRTRR